MGQLRGGGSSTLITQDKNNIRGFLSAAAVGAAIVIAALCIVLAPTVAGFDDDTCLHELNEGPALPHPAAGWEQGGGRLFPPQARCVFRLSTGEKVVRLVEPRTNDYLIAYGIAGGCVVFLTLFSIRAWKRRNVTSV